jgi:hypothetical protein
MYVRVDEWRSHLWKLTLDKETVCFEGSTHMLHLNPFRMMCSSLKELRDWLSYDSELPKTSSQSIKRVYSVKSCFDVYKFGQVEGLSTETLAGDIN